MATIRQLTASLGFKIDTAPAEKFNRTIKNTQAALNRIKTQKTRTQLKLLITSLRNTRKAIKKNGLAKQIRLWLQAAKDAIKTHKKKLLDRLKTFRSNLKAKIKNVLLAFTPRRMGEAVRKWLRSARDALKSNTKKLIDKLTAFKTRLKSKIKTVLRAFNPRKIGAAVKRWLAAATKNLKAGSKKLIEGLGGLVKKINIKTALLRGAMAAAAAIGGTIYTAARLETAEAGIVAMQDKGALEDIRKQYKAVKEESRGMFTDIDTAQASASFLSLYNNMESLKSLMPLMTKVAIAHNKTLEEVARDFGSAILSGSEESVRKYAIYTTTQLELISEGKKRGLGDYRMMQRVGILRELAAKYASENIDAIEYRLDNVASKMEQLTGTGVQAVTELGKPLESYTKEGLDMLIGALEGMNMAIDITKHMMDQDEKQSGISLNSFLSGLVFRSKKDEDESGGSRAIKRISWPGLPFRQPLGANQKGSQTSTTNVYDNRKVVTNVKTDANAEIIGEAVNKGVQKGFLNTTYVNNNALNTVKQGANQ